MQIINRTGKPWDTRVYNAETGETLDCIAEIGPMRPSDSNEITLHIPFVYLDIVSDYVQIVTTCPHCQETIPLEKKP